MTGKRRKPNAATRCRCTLISRPHYVGDHDQQSADARRMVADKINTWHVMRGLIG